MKQVMKYVIGIDEAGRGPLAGPVAVGAVCVPTDFDWSQVEGATDSKKMTPKSREEIYKKMLVLRREGKLDFAVAFSSAPVIDTRGIVPAIQSALNRSLKKLVEARPRQAAEVGPRQNAKTKPSYQILLDGGLHAPAEFKNQKTIIRGDDSEPVISLASIAAKVMRDRLMVRIAHKYPRYGLEIHKGYGTLAHRKAIKQNGLSPIHRKTFCH